jgi:hypothetical protein
MERKKMGDAAATRMNMLLQVVNLLATQYDQQVEAFPDFVLIPDEIALLFEDVSLFIATFFREGYITSSQKEKIDALSTLFDTMSENQGLWTREALKTSSQWQQVRVSAKEILESFHEEPHPPHLFWIHYMPDEKKRT